MVIISIGTLSHAHKTIAYTDHGTILTGDSIGDIMTLALSRDIGLTTAMAEQYGQDYYHAACRLNLVH